MKKLLGLTLLLLLIQGCDKPNAPDCFQHAGEVIEEWRALGAYERIEIYDNIQVVLIESDEEKLSVEGPENLIPEIITELEQGVLKIRNDNTCNFVRSYKHRYIVRIYSAHIESVINHGNGDVISANVLEGDYLFFENKRSIGKIDLRVSLDSLRFLNTTGYSDIEIAGEVDVSFLFHQGVGIMDASMLESRATYINSNTINDAYVQFRDYMFAAIYDSGNIYYNGPSAVIESNQPGSGSLIAQ